MKKQESDETIVIAGSLYRDIPLMIASGFSECGVKPFLLEWDKSDRNPFERKRGPLELATMFARSVRGRRRNLITDERNSSCLRAALQKLMPSYVLILNGVTLDRGTSDYCEQHGIKTALWAYDSVRHFPWIVEAAREYDFIYTYEPDDVSVLSHCGRTAFLPLACDPSIYCPPMGQPLNGPDICFVGSIRPTHRERMHTLQRIADALPQRLITVLVDRVPDYTPTRALELILACGRPNLSLQRGSVSHDEINELYNRTRICLNIHHRQSSKACNPRTFEILGSGSFLMTDRKLGFDDDYEIGGHYGFYSTIEEAIDGAGLYLSDPAKLVSVAAKGHELVIKRHTYRHRASQMLCDLRR